MSRRGVTLDEFVRATVATLPPLTDEQCARVAELLRSGAAGTGRAAA